MLVADIEAAQTHDLRRRVLRGGRDEHLVFPEDALPGAFHLGARPGPGKPLVAVASFAPEATPHRPARQAARLRGMVTEPDLQGQGYGRRLLAEAVTRLRADGFDVLWANARDSAVGFYDRLGFEVVGEGFLAGPYNDIAHHIVILDL